LSSSSPAPPGPNPPDQNYLVIKTKHITPDIQKKIDECLNDIPRAFVALSQTDAKEGGTRKAKKDKKKRRKSHRFHKLV
jgi:hypothetical protein